MTRIALVVFFSCFPMIAFGQSLTIDRALERVESLEALQNSNEAAVRSVESRAQQAGRWDGPELGLGWMWIDERESEFEAEVFQPIPLDSAPSLSRASLESEARAVRYEADARVQAYKADVASAFYEALFRIQTLEVLDERAGAVERTRGFLEKRRAAGDVAVYEVERLDREVRRLRLRIDREKAEVARELGRLQALLQTDFESIEGELAVDACGGEASVPPRLSALDSMAEAASVRVEAAERSWIPSLGIGAGYILNVNPLDEVAHGYLVGLSLGIPLWQSSELEADAAEARVVALRAELMLEREKVERSAASSLSRCDSLKANAAAIEASIPKTRKMLERAESGYSAGELSLLELLDAQESVLEDRLDLIAAQWSARRSQIEWKTTTGSWQ